MKDNNKGVNRLNVVMTTHQSMRTKLELGIITAREYADFLAQTDKMIKRWQKDAENED